MSPSQIASRNTRLFVAFRIFFNARFYYPIFAVIFLDFGLTLEQFALLNVIWAITIILAEVPLGAVSDLIGRKKLLVCTAILMVAEIVVWALAPQSNPTILFWCLVANRILSGLGEAAASGSDEALVYDSLEQANQKDKWSQVLATMGRWQSVAFMVAMLTGGIIYDANLMQKASDLLGIETIITQQTVLRWPLYLNIVTALITLYIASQFIEPEESNKKTGHSTDEKISIGKAFSQVWDAGKWIVHTPFAFVIILAGAFADSVIRMFVTLASEYYRLIDFSPASFGFIGAGIGALGFFTAPLGKKMVDNLTPTTNYLIAAAIALVGFIGASFFIPYIGLIFAIMLFVAFSIVSFSISYYLNHITEKSKRATVLSFKSMALNLGYGFIGVLYARLIVTLRTDPTIGSDKDLLFKEAIGYFPIYFAIGLIIVITLSKLRCRNINTEFKHEEQEAKES